MLKGVGGDAVRACGSVLYRIQVRVNPCGARGGAGRSHTLSGMGERERVRFLSHGEASRLVSVSMLLKSQQADEPQVWPISP